MTHEALIRKIRDDLSFMGQRGFATTACNVGELCKRFENLEECFKLLAAREEMLTQKLVELGK